MRDKIVPKNILSNWVDLMVAESRGIPIRKNKSPTKQIQDKEGQKCHRDRAPPVGIAPLS